jgi:hypothetical protein
LLATAIFLLGVGLFVGEAATSPIAEIAAGRKRMGISAGAALCGGK